jgi:lipopolysaccharide transport system ATP-binding protein
MPQPVIEIEHLSKCYRIGAQREPYLSLRDTFARKAGHLWNILRRKERVRPAQDDFWALKDVSFSVQPGEAVGIIGRNGAGKSTLLKILSQITPPTEGQITMRGRVASLLEVGTGFHQELTGRENIFLNGTILGMTRAEIKKKFDEIVAFSEIGKFLETPVKRYSSGMYVRLAFAVAAHLEPEILIVDEVLAVGDAQFQKKCLGRMQAVSKQEGRTVLFVSHNMGAVASLCPRAVWLDGGKIQRAGVARGVIHDYLTQRGTDDGKTLNLAISPRQYGGDRLRLESLEWLCHVPLQHGEPLCARIQFRINSPVEDVAVGFGFSTIEGTRMLSYDTDFQDGHRPSLSEAGSYSVRVEIDSLPLGPGIFSLDVGCRSGDLHALDYVPAAVQVEVIPGPKTPGYIVRQDAGVRLPSRWSWDR